MTPNLEAGILGCLLAFPELLPDAMAALKADDFTDGPPRRLFTAACDLHTMGDPIDGVMIIAQAGDDCRNYAKQAIDCQFSRYAFDGYLERARDERNRETARTLASELWEALNSNLPTDMLQPIATRLSEALTASPSNDELTAKQGRIDFIQRQAEETRYISTGFYGLDKGLYIEPGDYVILGGRPSSGKTAFSLNLAANIARKHRVVYFSLETSGEKIIDRLMASIFLLDFADIKKHALPVEKQAGIIQRRELMDSLDITIVEAAGKTVPWIQAKAMKLKADIIFVDYLGLLSGEGKSRYEQVTSISVALHTMAQRTKTVVFALCQLNRSDGEKDVPTMKSLRESGQIEQDADIIMFIHQPDANDKLYRKIIVAKNKEGVTASQDMHFDGSKQLFLERTSARR